MHTKSFQKAKEIEREYEDYRKSGEFEFERDPTPIIEEKKGKDS
jgi:hypothetical protein